MCVRLCVRVCVGGGGGTILAINKKSVFVARARRVSRGRYPGDDLMLMRRPRWSREEERREAITAQAR